MSETANWSYTNTATVKPYVGMDDWGGSVFWRTVRDRLHLGGQIGTNA